MVLSLVPAVASAQVVWTQAQAASSKPATRQPLAYDSTRGVTVSFGAYFQAANGVWRIRGQFKVTGFGQDGDLPAPGDYDGDGTTDPAFFRPSTGTWHTLASADLQAAAAATQSGAPFLLDTEEVEFGQHGDLPVPGDYDGDGVTDLALYRPSKRLWIVKD